MSTQFKVIGLALRVVSRHPHDAGQYVERMEFDVVRQTVIDGVSATADDRRYTVRGHMPLVSADLGLIEIDGDEIDRAVIADMIQRWNERE